MENETNNSNSVPPSTKGGKKKREIPDYHNDFSSAYPRTSLEDFFADTGIPVDSESSEAGSDAAGGSETVRKEAGVGKSSSRKRTGKANNPDETSSVPVTKVSVSVNVQEILRLYLLLYNKKNPESKITVREFVDEALQRHMKKLSSEVYIQSIDILSKG